ncbi:hypothetical protein [Desulfovibrio inopinatus]|uniref:hypothetical protein n=1 Tax=Desulfovibrio inopinatus TaxID=102109 RepID=UPI0004271502|nr:hypothetical protein [Desulfovibrio inopinatus]
MKRILFVLIISIGCNLALSCLAFTETLCLRPYTDDSPWNLPIGPDPVIDPQSDHFIRQFDGIFGCNPSAYTYPVYSVTPTTPDRIFLVTGIYSNVVDNGTRLDRRKNISLTLKAPRGAKPAQGHDAQIILHNPVTGDEWGFWKSKKQGPMFKTQNGYHYNTHWSGVPPSGFMSRGAGMPYLAGLVRPCELLQGHIDHALALAVNDPSPLFVYPAIKSDGDGPISNIPEGARLQLDPSLTEADFDAMGLSEPARILARAMQTYGLIVVDKGGHPKIMIEYEGSADWSGLLDEHSIRSIPYHHLRVLSLNTPAVPEAPALAAAGRIPESPEHIAITWTPSASATSYRIFRFDTMDTPSVIAITTAQVYTDLNPPSAPQYAIQAINHNGASALTPVVMP